MIFFCVGIAHSQVLKNTEPKNLSNKDTLVVDKGGRDSVKIFKPKFTDYLHYTQFSEKKPFDTVFTTDKSYQFSQFNNRDNFGKIQFAWSALGTLILFGGLLVFAIFLRELWLGVIVILILFPYAALILWDRNALIARVKRALR